MSRSPRKSTNIFRQFDPSALRQLGQPIAPIVESAVIEDDGASVVTLTFNTPVAYDAILGSPPAWQFGGESIASISAISSDGRTVTVNITGVIDLGAAYTITSSDEDHFIKGLNGGYLQASTGVVTLFNPTDTFNVVSVEITDPNDIRITFDAPVAVVPRGDAPPNPDWSGYAIASSTLGSIGGSPTPTTIEVSIDPPSTSGVTYIIPGGVGSFVSLTGARLNAKTGIVSGG